MANKNDVKRTASSINSQWLNNTLRSLGVASRGVISDLAPATVGTITSGATLAADTARAVKTMTRTGKIQSSLESTKAVQVGKEFFKNAISDIKTGNLYNESRNAFGDSEEGFDIDNMFGDIDDYADGEETNVNIQNNVVDNSATLKMIERQTEYQVQSAKATVETMVSVGSASIANVNQIGMKVLSELSTINKNLAALIDYQNTNMTRFIEASIGYYDQMSRREEEYQKEKRISSTDVFGSKGALDFNAYKDLVKQNINDLKDDSMVGSMVSMILDNKDMIIANPIGNILRYAVIPKLVPGIVKETMSTIDSAVQDAIPNLLESIGDMADSDGMIKQIFGKVFGTRTSRKKEFDTSKIQKGPMPYNGIVNHTLVEIIPKYLRESNTYLKEIAEAVTGKTKDQMSDDFTGFDWSTGKFSSIKDMQKNIRGMLDDETISTYERSKFGKEMASRGKYLSKSEDQEKFTEVLNNFFKQYTLANNSDLSDKTNVSNLLDSSKAEGAIRNLIEATLESMAESAEGKLLLSNAKATRRNSINRRNSTKSSIESNPNDYNLYQAESIAKSGEWADEGDSVSVYSTPRIAGNISPIGVIMSIPNLIGNIQKTLERGIYVQIKNNLDGKSNQTRTSDGMTITPSGIILPSGYNSSATVNTNINSALNDESQVQSVEEFKELFGKDVSNEPSKGLGVKGMISSMMNGILHGDADGAWDAFVNGLTDSFKKIGEKISNEFLLPLKKSLFGEKDDDGYLRGGLFEGVNNRLKESMLGFRRMITGKGYKTADGEVIADMNAEEKKNSVLGKLSSMASSLGNAIKVRLFGEEEVDENGNKIEKEGLIGKVKNGLFGITDSFAKGLHGWKVALFGKEEGDDSEDAPKKTLEKFKEKTKEVLPDALAGGAAGGLLGFMVGGPIGGALLGFAGGIAKNSKKFQKFLFGDEETGKEGVINKKVQDYVKKNGKFLAGGAAIGGLSGLTGIGLLGTIAGGPVAGALLGLGSSMLVKSEMFQKFLFGDEKNGQLGLFKTVKGWFGKFGKVNIKDVNAAKIGGMAGIGAGAGGLLGLAFSPIGPIGGAILGLGASMLAQKDNFHEWLFGKKDEKGNKVKEGVLGQFKNMMMANVIHPMVNTFKDIGRDAKVFLEHDILNKFNLVIEPIGNALFSGASKLLNKSIGSLSDLGNYIKEDFLHGAVEKLGNVMAPLTDAVSGLAKGLYIVGKTILKAPLDIIGNIVTPVAGAIGTVVGGAAKATFAVVDNVLVKPLKTLVLKPLGATIKFATNAVLAPIKFLGNTITKVTERLGMGIEHIQRFVGAIGDKVVDTISKPFIAIKDNVVDKLTKAKEFISDNIISPIKAEMKEVRDAAKKQIKNFFHNLASKIISGITTPFKKLGGWIGGTLGEGINNAKGGLLKLWRDTAAGGEGADHSGAVRTLRRANRWNKEAAEQKRAENKKLRDAERERNRNERLIAKYTKNQAFEDTEANRKMAERMSGRKIRFKGEAVKPPEVKQVEIQTDINKNTQEAKDYSKKSEKTLRDILSVLKSKFGFQKRKDIPRNEYGTDYAEAGYAIVGEAGPEVVYGGRGNSSKFGRIVGIGGPEVIHMNGGETVIPNSRIRRFEEGTNKDNEFDHSKLSDTQLEKSSDSRKLTVSERILKTINDIKNKFAGGKNPGDFDRNGNPLPTIGGGLTGENLRAANEMMKEEDEDDAREEGILARLKDLTETTKEHAKTWSGIFGKKGIITLALLAGIPLLLKFLKNFDLSGLLGGAVGNIINNILGGAGAAVEDAVNDYHWTGDHGGLTNGNTKTQEAARVADMAKDGNILFLGEDGSATKMTTPAMSVLARKGLNFAFSKNHLPFESKFTTFDKSVANVAKGIGNGFKGFFKRTSNYDDLMKTATFSNAGGWIDDAGKRILSTSTKKQLLDEGVDIAARYGDDVIFADDTVRLGGRMLNKVDDVAKHMGTAIKGNAVVSKIDDVAKSTGAAIKNVAKKTVDTAKDNKLLNKVIEVVENFFTSISEKFAKKTSKKAADAGVDAVKKSLLSTIKTKWDDIAEKIAAKIAARTGVSVSAATVTFGVSELVMATISGINGVSGTAKLFNISPDKVDGKMKLIAGIFGAFEGTTLGGYIDIILSIVGSIVGIDFLNSIAVGMYNFLVGPGSTEAEALTKAQDEWHDTYLKERSSDVEAEYKTQKAAGIIGADVTLEDFNAGINDGTYHAQYKSFQDWNVEKNAAISDKIATGFGKGMKWVGKQLNPLKTALLGSTTSSGTDDMGNTYVLQDDGTYKVYRDGKDIGNIAANALPETANIETSTSTGLVQRAGSAIKNAGASIVSAIKAPFVLTGFHYATKDGDYYDEKGNHFSAAGEPLPNPLTVEQLEEGVKNSILTKTEIKEPTALGKTVGKFMDSIRSDWKNSNLLGKAAMIIGAASGPIGIALMGKLSTGIQSLFTKKTVKYITPNGDYYDANGKHYSSNGDELPGEPLTKEELELGIKDGTFTYEEIKEDTKLTKGIKTRLSQLREAWKNSSTLGKIGTIIGAAGGPLGMFITNRLGNKISSFFTTKNIQYCTDAGDYYDEKGNHYSANGEELGDSISQEELMAAINGGELTRVESSEPTALGKKMKEIGASIKDRFVKLKEGWDKSSGLGKLGTLVGAAWGPLGMFIGNKLGNTGTFLLNTHKKMYVASDGSYYDSEGKHFSSIGDDLGETLPIDQLEAAVAAGELSIQEIDSKPANIKEAFANVRANSKVLWEKAKTRMEELANKLKEKASSIMGSIKDKANSVIGTAKDKVDKFFTKDTVDTAYVLPENGGYYTSTGEYFTVDGEPIESMNISAAELVEMINNGEVSRQDDYVVRERGFVVAFRDAKTKLIDAKNNLMQNVSNWWGTVTTKFSDKAKELGQKARDGLKNAVTKLKDSYSYVDIANSGAYYDSQGNYYSSSGELLEEHKVTPEEVMQMSLRGELNPINAKVYAKGNEIVAKLGTTIADAKQKLAEAKKNITDKLTGTWNNIVSWGQSKINSITSGVEKIKNTAATITEEFTSYVYVADDGTYYDSEGNLYSASGDLITEGAISPSDVLELSKSGVLQKTTYGFHRAGAKLSEIGEKIASFGSNLHAKIKDTFDNTITGLSDMWEAVKKTGVSEVWAQIKDKGLSGFLKELTTHKSENVYMSADGCYYKFNGKSYDEYNANGDKIAEGIPADKIDEMVKANLLTPTTMEVNSEAQKSVKKIKDAVKGAWSKASDTVKDGWDKFTKWISGGSGNGTMGSYIKTQKKVMGGSGYGYYYGGGRGEYPMPPYGNYGGYGEGFIPYMEGGYGPYEYHNIPSGRPSGGRGNYSYNHPYYGGYGEDTRATVGRSAMSTHSNNSYYHSSYGGRGIASGNYIASTSNYKNDGYYGARQYKGAHNNYIFGGKGIHRFKKGGRGIFRRGGFGAKDIDAAVEETSTSTSRGSYGVKELRKCSYGNIHNYWIFKPSANSKNLPIIVFLHGDGETSSNPDVLISRWLPNWLYSGQLFVNAIVIAPQQTQEGANKPNWNANYVKQIVDEVIKNDGGDSSRVSVTGQSRGGSGTMACLGNNPNFYSCGAVFCGYSSSNLASIKQPVIGFVGANDSSALPCSRSSFNTINGAGGNAALYIAKGEDHNSICRAYKVYNVLEWLISHRAGSKLSTNPGLYDIVLGDKISGLRVVDASASTGNTPVPSSGSVSSTATDLSTTSTDSSSSSTDATSSDDGDIFSRLSSFFSTLGNGLISGTLTGTFDHSIWDSYFTKSSGSSSSSSGSSSGQVLSANSNITGSNNAEKIWNYFSSKNMPKAGIAGLMGNLQAESGLQPNNLQNSYNTKFKMSDDEYTNAVNNGSYTKFGSDSAGYGLAQWTSGGRKQGLLNYAKSKNLRIDDLGMQLDWLWNELQSSYKGVYSTLMNPSSLQEASNAVLHKFEAPADQSTSVENFRASNGQSFYNLYAGNGGSGRGAYYSQNDPRWANEKFVRSDGVDDGATMGNSGCGPTAMAMALSQMGTDATPPELAQLAQISGTRDETGTNWGFIDSASAAYGVDSAMSMNPSAANIEYGLSGGNPMILSGVDNGSGTSPYTTAGHYVVATGIDGSGNVSISDPRGAGYSRTMKASELAGSTGAAWAFGGNGTGRRLSKVKFKKGGRGQDTEKWLNIIKSVKAALAAQNPTYYVSGKNEVYNTITVGGVSKRVRPDCSGLVLACLQYFGVVASNVNMSSANFANKNDTVMNNTGFSYKPFTSWDSLQPGDIIAVNNTAKGGSLHHVEIYAGKFNGSYLVYNGGSTSALRSAGPTAPAHPNDYTTVWTPGDAGSGAVINTDVTANNSSSSDSSSSKSSSSSSFDGIFEKLGLLGKFGTTLFEGVLTGDLDSSKWDDAFGTSDTADDNDTITGGSGDGPSISTRRYSPRRYNRGGKGAINTIDKISPSYTSNGVSGGTSYYVNNNDANLQQLLTQVITLLSGINDNTGNLSALKDIQSNIGKGVVAVNNTTNNIATSNTNSSKSSNKTNGGGAGTMSRNERVAREIVFSH